MPIVEEAPLNEALRSGDVVRLANGGVCLDKDFNALQSDKAKYGLVISRDCAGENGEAVLVAEVHPTQVDLRKLARVEDARAKDLEKHLEDALGVFALARDGSTAPDRFYLGVIGGEPSRWAARFDRILHIEVPKGRDARQAWTNQNRVARLTPDFQRSLSTRLYWALCRAGFDDHNWFDTKDLEYLLQVADAWVAELTKEVKIAEANLSQASAAGQPAKKLEQLSKELDSASRELQRAEARVAGFRDALRLRGPLT